ncbi:MAG: hypothetical protein DMG21_07695 [Acidobacteria bacterium]|nr:MAG: hypothetical protein DMG21_07695 [Acidobacteriota bacterium]
MPKIESQSERCSSCIDYDLHGLVGVRLVNPSKRDVAAVEGQLGPLQRPLTREPDFVLRFVDHLETPGMRYLGLEAGFTDDGRLVLSNDVRLSKVSIPFAQIGREQFEIVCESGLRSVPLLTAILNLTILKKDHVALHASAFVHKGTGVLATAWTKGGKTEALLAFGSHAAEYIGDEWIWLSADGQRMYGIPGNILIWDWQLKHLPRLRAKVGTGDRLMFGAINSLERMERIVPHSKLDHMFPLKFLREAMPRLRGRRHVRLTPQEIFEARLGPLVASPEIAIRMVASIHYEQSAFEEFYLAFKFAFPGVRNEFLEHAAELQASILCRALAGKEAYLILHPYPDSLPGLYEAMEPFCGRPLREQPGVRVREPVRA